MTFGRSLSMTYKKAGAFGGEEKTLAALLE